MGHPPATHTLSSLPILAVIVVCICLLLFVRRVLEAGKSQQAMSKLAPIASSLGLTVSSGKWRTKDPDQCFINARGSIAGREVLLCDGRLGRKSANCAWLYVIPASQRGFPNCDSRMPISFTLGHRSALSGVAESLSAANGHATVKTADASFDAQWVVRTDRPEYLQAALGPEIRARIMAAEEDLREAAVIGFNSLISPTNRMAFGIMGGLGKEDTAEVLARHIPLMLDLATIGEDYRKPA